MRAPVWRIGTQRRWPIPSQTVQGWQNLSCTKSKAPEKGPVEVKSVIAGGDYRDSALKARAVMSSKLPKPLMARYFGAEAASAWAQLE